MKTQIETKTGSTLTTFYKPDAVAVDSHKDGTVVVVIRHQGEDHVLTFEPDGGPLSVIDEVV